MFSGGNRNITPAFRVQDHTLTLRPYNEKLNQLAAQICSEVGQAESDRCLFETRTAFDCVLRNKVRKFGDIMDIQGACKNHITNMKEALGVANAPLLDVHLEEVAYMRKSFV